MSAELEKGHRFISRSKGYGIVLTDDNQAFVIGCHTGYSSGYKIEKCTVPEDAQPITKAPPHIVTMILDCVTCALSIGAYEH